MKILKSDEQTALDQALKERYQETANRRFTTGRGLEEYEKMFAVSSSGHTFLPLYLKDGSVVPKKDIAFHDVVSGLKENQSWLDVGTGQGNAIVESAPLTKGKVYGLDLVPPSEAMKDAVKKQSNLHYIGPKTLKELADSGEFDGAFSLITDFFAAATYSPNLDQVFRDTAQLLEPGGRYYVMIPTQTYAFNFAVEYPATHLVAKSAKAKRLLQVEKRLADVKRAIRKKPGEESPASFWNHWSPESRKLFMTRDFAPLLAWIELFQGLEVEALGWGSLEAGFVVVFKRTADPVLIPELKIESYEMRPDGAGPPVRNYSF